MLSKNFIEKISSTRQLFLYSIFLVLILWGGNYALRSYWDPDEPRFVLIAREMMANGHFFVPYRHGVEYAHKPPLMMWLITLGEKLFPTPFGSRLPSFIGSVLSIFSLFKITSFLYNKHTAIISTIVFSTSIAIWSSLAIGQIDALLLGFELLSLSLLIKGCSVQTTDKRLIYIITAGLSLGMAVFAKGPVGLIIPLGSFFAFYFTNRNNNSLCSLQRILFQSPSQIFILFFITLIPISIFLIGAYFENASHEYFHEILFSQSAGRIGTTYGHKKYLLSPFVDFIFGFFPWSLIFPFCFFSTGNKRDKIIRNKLTVWLLFVLIFFCIPSCKRSVYILMTYPAASILVANNLENIFLRRTPRNICYILMHLLFIIAILFPFSLLLIHICFGNSFIAKIYSLRNIISASLSAIIITSAFIYTKKYKPHYKILVFFFVLFFSIGTFITPIFNAIKSPIEIQQITKKHLSDKTERILLYDDKAENITLYSNHFAYEFFDKSALQDYMHTKKYGLIVTKEKDFINIEDIFDAYKISNNEVRFGKKKYNVILFEERKNEL